MLILNSYVYGLTCAVFFVIVVGLVYCCGFKTNVNFCGGDDVCICSGWKGCKEGTLVAAPSNHMLTHPDQWCPSPSTWTKSLLESDDILTHILTTLQAKFSFVLTGRHENIGRRSMENWLLG